VCALAAALWLLMHHLRAYKLGDVWREIQTFPGPALLLSGLLVVLNIPVIIYLDVLAVRWLHRLLAYRRIALVSFLSAAFGRTVGFPIFTGGGLRYRFYRPWGFSLKEVGQLTTFYFASLWLGFLAWAGATLTLQPLRIQADWAEKLPSLRFVGVLLLAGLAGYLFLSLRRKPLRLFGFEVPQVPLGLALGQIGLSMLKWLLDAATLYVLLQAKSTMPVLPFTSAYFAAQVVSILSHAPGGLGVFDTAFLLLLKSRIPPPTLLGALAVYRALYNILPLIPAVPLYFAAEARIARRAKSNAT